MTQRRTIVASLSMSLLAGCVVGPDFRTPPLPSASGPVASSISPDPAWPQWWKPFAWPGLDELMQAAVAGNRDLLAAQAQWNESLARAGATAGAASPQLDVDLGAGREKYGYQFLGPQKISAFQYRSVTATATWLLDYVGGEKRAVERDRAYAEYRQHQVNAAYLTMTGNILLQATAAASARAQITAAEGILQRDTQAVQIAQTAYEAGNATRMELINAQSQLARDRTLLPPLRQDLSRAEHALAVLIGRPATQWAAPELAFDDAVLPTISASLPSEWLRSRPDIRAAEAQLHVATAALGVATADLYPRIRLGASYGPQARSVSDLFDEASMASSLVAGITVPIFDGGSLRARRTAAEAAMQSTLAQYEKTVLESFAQVADLLQALEQDADLIEAQLAAGDAAAARLSLARQSHDAGNTGIQPILEAERTGLLARLTYIDSLAQQREDAVRLILALGGDMPLQTASPE